MKLPAITATALFLLLASPTRWLPAHEIEIGVEIGPQGLSVRVTYEDGGPADGAHVSLRPEHEATSIAEGAADAGGVWRAPLPAPGAYEITASHGGHREEVDLEIAQAPGGKLEARVLDHEDHEGSPARGRILRIVGGGLALLLVGIAAGRLLGRRPTRGPGNAGET